MTRHIGEERLHDYQDGLLSREEEERVMVHLRECPTCRAELDHLSSLSGELGSLPLEAEPSRDLWPQIAWRLAQDRVHQPGSEGPVESETPETSVGSENRTVRRVSLPAWQLLAASIALMLVSGGVVWTFLSGTGEPVSVADPLPRTPSQFVGWEEAYSGYDAAVADLENLLETGRRVLDPETVRVLEESLQTIDQAIAEAGEAVSQDPASPVLQRLLADTLRKKMDLLRKAAMAVYAIT